MSKLRVIWGVSAAAAMLTTACLFESGSDRHTTPTIPSGPCVDVPAAAAKTADSLVELANDQMVDNFDYWFNDASSWDQVKRRNPQVALSLYEQALVVAPGHCQAVFGRGVASATMITQDKKMDDFIKKVEAADGVTNASPGAKVGSLAALMKTSPDKAAPVLLKLSANLQRVDYPTVREVQELIEQVIMPRLDSTIKALETVMDYSMFAVRLRIDHDGGMDTVEIDRGEVGPGLAGLKVAKAYLTVIAGYDWELAVDGKYDWIDTLSDLDDEDFDNLTPGQKASLDRLEKLFEQNSPFTQVRAAWKEKVQGIPALLLTGVADAQKGLQSAIDEAASGKSQKYDIWRAGSGEDADVDTADLRIAIELLERSKKYLKGEETVKYNRGSLELKVNFAKLFQLERLQGILPYFKFYPYPEWNDTVSADTSWYGGSFIPSGPTSDEVFARMGLGNRSMGGEYPESWNLYINSFFNPVGPDQFAVHFTAYHADNSYEDSVVGTLNPDPVHPCRFTFIRSYRLEPDPAGPGMMRPSADADSGVFVLSACREIGGMAEYIGWIDAVVKGPIYFTDAAGNKTLGTHELDQYSDDIRGLKGKILFRDPTFGGIFPDLSNDNIWDKIKSLETVEDRVQRICSDYPDPYKCRAIMPSNPSDLDYFVYSLYWLDDLLY